MNNGLANRTILIIRHAEKPSTGTGLDARGKQRAQLYADYFCPFRVDGQDLLPRRLIATADSAHSSRPRLTITPLSERLQLPVEQPFADDQTSQLVAALRGGNDAPVVLICWHHGHIDKLIHAFGGDPGAITGYPGWPADVFDWVVMLRFDGNAALEPAACLRVIEYLLPGDGHADR